MYEVFLNEHPILLTNKLSKETDFKLFLLDTFSIEEIVRQFNKGVMKKAHLYHPDAELLLKKFKNKISTVIAAGGIVKNAKHEVLFIYRNDKWDLPKGKVNKGETTERAAIREIEEETGVKNLTIERFFKKTYHIFKSNGSYKLKETYWYAITTDYKGTFVPQYNEGIEQVLWKNELQTKEALKNSYRNIKKLLAGYH